MKAFLEIECSDPDIVLKAMKPDIEETAKFNAKLDPKENKLELTVESESISGLLAGINSYMRLIKTAIDVNEV
jgi:tRNA threonylcarbamoyladenosine modification (KEOPS) complex  Pcc1 subunit